MAASTLNRTAPKGADTHVPLLVHGARVKRQVALGTRATFADVAQTLSDNFGLGVMANGTSFLREIVAG